MSEILDHQADQNQDSKIKHINLQLARIRQVFWRSYESSINFQPGQDYLAWKADEHNLAFCVSDGVGSSFAGQIAAKFFADRLVDLLFRVPIHNVTDSLLFRKELEKKLNQWSKESQAEVARYEIPGNLADMFREALQELKTVYGSQTVFLCGKIEAHPGKGSRVLLAGAGDMYAYALDRQGQAINLGLVRDNSNRISTVSGVEGQIQVWISDPDQPVSRLVLFSDGLGFLGEQVLSYNDEQLMKAVEASVLEATSDDIAFLDIKIDPQETSCKELEEINLRKPDLPEQELNSDDEPVYLPDHNPELTNGSFSQVVKNFTNLYSIDTGVPVFNPPPPRIEDLPVVPDATLGFSTELFSSPDTNNFESISGEAYALFNYSFVDHKENEKDITAVQSWQEDLNERSVLRAEPEIIKTLDQPISSQTPQKDLEEPEEELISVESDSSQRPQILKEPSLQYSFGSHDSRINTQPQQILPDIAELAREEIPPVKAPIMVQDSSFGLDVKPEISGIETHQTSGDKSDAGVQRQEAPGKNKGSVKGMAADIFGGIIMSLNHPSKVQGDTIHPYNVDSFIAGVDNNIRTYMGKMNHSKLAQQTFVEYLDSSNKLQIFKNNDQEIRALNLQSKNKYLLTLEYKNGQQWNINIEYDKDKDTFHLTFRKLSQK